MSKVKKIGRPLIQLDYTIMDKLISNFCTQEEIADILECSISTLNRACKRDHDCTFEEYYKKHNSGGKSSLRRMQYDAAKTGNPTMLIWLGKQYLDQKDRQEHSHEVKGKLNVLLSEIEC